MQHLTSSPTEAWVALEQVGVSGDHYLAEVGKEECLWQRSKDSPENSKQSVWISKPEKF